MSTKKERHRVDLIEVEGMKRRWQEYTKNYTKIFLMTQITMMVCVITHLEPDILECAVNWVLGSIIKAKANGDDGIPTELFQILKDDAVKMLHSLCRQFGKLSSDHRTGKDQFSFQSQRRAVPKNIQTTAQLHLPHMLAK